MKRARHETRAEIWEFCYAVYNGAGRTRKDIAENLGLKKSPHLIEIINELVSDNWLGVEQSTLPNGAICYIYHAKETGE